MMVELSINELKIIQKMVDIKLDEEVEWNFGQLPSNNPYVESLLDISNKMENVIRNINE